MYMQIELKFNGYVHAYLLAITIAQKKCSDLITASTTNWYVQVLCNWVCVMAKILEIQNNRNVLIHTPKVNILQKTHCFLSNEL
jgi:hypothetical protein